MRILVVDQDNATVEQISSVLEEHTEHVLSKVSEPQKALQVARARRDIDVLITEIVMEEMDGFSLSAQVQEVNPQLRVIFMSGYDMSEYAGYLEGHSFLYKPIDQSLLLKALEALESGESVVSQVGDPSGAPSLTEAAAESDAETEEPAEEQATPASEPEPEPEPSAEEPEEKAAEPQAAGEAAGAAATHAAQQSSGIPQGTRAPGDESATVPPRAEEGESSEALSSPQDTPPEQESAEASEEASTAAKTRLQPVPKTETEDTEKEPEEQPETAETAETAPAQEEEEEDVKKTTGAINESGTSEDLPEEPSRLSGYALGGYQIQEHLGRNEWGETYKAIQTAMDRTVMLVVVKRQHELDRKSVEKFLEQARSKASLQQESILSVYEAGHIGDYYYCAQEYVEGKSLAELTAEGKRLDNRRAMNVLRNVAEAYAYLHHQNTFHAMPTAENIFVGNRGVVRIENPALQNPDRVPDPKEEMEEMSRIMMPLVNVETDTNNQLSTVILNMSSNAESAANTWEDLLQLINSFKPGVKTTISKDLISRKSNVPKAIQEAHRKQRRSLLISFSFTFLFLLLVVLFILFRFNKPKKLDYYGYTETIPAGEFIYQDGQVVNQEEFFIDKYEVTIGDYNEFVEFLRENPTTQYDHPEQPSGLTHIPEKWNEVIASATRGRPWQGARLTPNMPVFDVNWYDAYAYANWRNGRLPTDMEWEKAARGEDGWLYPWGNEFKPKRLNSSRDYHQNPSEKGEVDGFNRWAPVDAFEDTDSSPYGVVHMAGNVREWTADMAPSPAKLGLEVPYLRGGSFASPGREAFQTTARAQSLIPEQSDRFTGFRVAYDVKPPTPEERRAAEEEARKLEAEGQ